MHYWGQDSVNRLVWESGYTQVVKNPTRGGALLDVYLVQPENLFTSCSVIEGVSDHCGMLLEVEWEEKFCRPIVERRVSVYHRADAMGLQTLLRGKFAIRAGNSGCVEEVWNSFKSIILQGIERFIPHRILRKIQTLIITIRKWKIKGKVQKSI
jgi:hypothetical protein